MSEQEKREADLLIQTKIAELMAQAYQEALAAGRSIEDAWRAADAVKRRFQKG